MFYGNGAVASPDGNEVLVVDAESAANELYFTISDLANGRDPRTVLHAMILGAESPVDVALMLGERPNDALSRVQALARAGILATCEPQDGGLQPDPITTQYKVL